ncbi:hypothetical protein ACIQNG_13200 [Streptomyces sp. NPDC091377]|uniref:hypothetical protein n=1 Tax=Streptomyces sp. NPDC091377 TaxID=3365995 RepID=UPI00380FE6C1
MTPVARAALAHPVLGAAEASTSGRRAAALPAAGGHGIARAVAAPCRVVAGGGAHGGLRILSPEAAGRVREGRGVCRDLVRGAGTGARDRTGAGTVAERAEGSYGPNPRALRAGRLRRIVRTGRSGGPTVARICEEPHGYAPRR